MLTVSDRKQGPVRHGRSIKILKVPGHIKDPPCPDRTEAKIISYTAVRLGGTFGEGDRSNDGSGERETAQQGHLKDHLVRGIPYLLVNVKGLGIDVADAFHLAKVLKEVPEPGREVFEVPIVHGDTNLVQEQGAVRLRPELRELGHRDNPNSWNAAILHIGIDMISPLHVMEHLMNHVAGLPCPLLPEDKGKLVGIVVLPGKIRQTNDSKKKNGNQ